MIDFASDSKVTLIGHNASDDYVAMSAWVSFGNDSEEKLGDRHRVERLINFLYRNQHLTPFESSTFTFRISTPIFVAREFFRHRSASYNEWSGRYSEMEPKFYLPSSTRPLIQKGKPGDYYFVEGTTEQSALVNAQQAKVFEVAWTAYQNLLTNGVAKEVARNVLPLSTYTYFYVTMNARNLMHFLSLRNDSHALYEIKAVAEQMEALFAEKMPLTYAAFDAQRAVWHKVNRLMELANIDELLAEHEGVMV